MAVAGVEVTYDIDQLDSPPESAQEHTYIMLISSWFGWPLQFQDLAHALAREGFDVATVSDNRAPGLQGALGENSVDAEDPTAKSERFSQLASYIGAAPITIFAFGESVDYLGQAWDSKVRVVLLDASATVDTGLAIYSDVAAFGLGAVDRSRLEDLDRPAAALSRGVGVLELSDVCTLDPSLDEVLVQLGSSEDDYLVEMLRSQCTGNGKATHRTLVKLFADLLSGPCPAAQPSEVIIYNSAARACD